MATASAKLHERKTGPAARAGLTFIEALIVLALFGAATLMTLPFSGVALGGRKVAAATELAADYLRQAQSMAMSGRNSRQFGVHFESDRFVLFEGAAYNPADPDNQEQLLDGDVSLGHILTGGVDDVLFGNHRGVPSVTGTVTLTAETGQYRIITVGPEGAIGE